MVDQRLVEYFRMNKGHYKLEDLKKKVLLEGYAQKDVDDAIAQLNKEIKGNPPTVDTTVKKINGMSFNSEKKAEPVASVSGNAGMGKKGGVKWMKIAGIIGIIFLISTIVILIASFFVQFTEPSPIDPDDPFQPPVSDKPVVPKPVSLIISIITFVLLLPFLYGFFKMGKYANSKLLQFSSMAFITILIIIAVLILILFATGTFDTIKEKYTGPSQGPMGVGAAEDTEGKKGLAKVLGIVTLLVLFLFIIFSFLFYSGLVVVSREVKFAITAGILGILGFYFISMIVMIRINIIFVFILLFKPNWNLTLNVITYLLPVPALLFESLALFYASRKFE